MKFIQFKILQIIGLIMLTQCLIAQKIKFYHCMVDLKEPQVEVMEKAGINEAKLVNGSYIDPTNTGILDSVSLKTEIEKLFPEPNSQGVGILDWENKTYDALKNIQNNGVSYSEALDQFLTMIRIAKTFRPNVEWGIYNLPYTTYWQKNDDWRFQAERLDTLFKMMDIFMPSLYDFYPDTTRFTDDKTYFSDNTKLALQLGQEFNKPVYVFIWQRYHESNPVVGLELIPENEFILDIKYILNTKYKNRGVDGIIWFDAQSYFHRLKKTLKASDVKAMKASDEKVKEVVLDKYAGFMKAEAGRQHQ